MHRLRLVLLGLAAVAAVVLGWSLVEQANRRAIPAVPHVAEKAPPVPLAVPAPSADAIAAERHAIEAKLGDAPDYMRFFDRLKAALPGEYADILDTFAKHALADGGTGNVDLWMAQAVRALRLSYGILAARADGATLTHVFDMQLAMMRALGDTDQRLCVDFLYGGASRGFYQFSAQHRPLVADMAIAGLDAITEGQDKRIERERPTPADFDALAAALAAKGLDQSEIDAILDGKTADPPIGDARMCQIGQLYLETLAALPEPVRLRIYGLAVELMARS